ncbi:glucose PTS transporter subunit IIA [Candidatus Stoquefichus sp. SB1]|uniref:glucose PTS transporter subunit IIA n=1 Tax=Candidatus Stoquefichus sp. SB1 TaxID=1658109 RepID=UPI00067E954F|nr:glucose PTS transporter subunit IIA [Candidatus Stoquefichus sp. SB1]
MNIEKNAIYILENIGGKENVNQVSHCATRLRFQVKNKDLIKKDIIENLEGIFGVHIIGNECQIIVGGDVIKYYPIIQSKIDKTENITVSKKKNSLKDYGFAFLDFVSGTMTPLIPALIGCSMIRGLLILLSQFGLMNAESPTYAILNAASNGIFYFLPILASFSAAKKLNVNPYIAACISAALMEPNFSGLMQNTGDIVDFFGIPVMMFNYASSLIPALLSTWLYSFLWKFLEKKMPSSIAGVFNPAICLFVFVPLTAILFGPIAYYIGNFVGDLFNSINGISPIIAGIFIGVTMNYLVISGVHWVITAICINEFALNGYSTLFGYWWCACISYIAIALGAIWVAKNKKERSLAISCSIVALFGGVSEPTLYSYLLRNKKYAIPMAISGALGGALAGILGTKATAFSMATIFTVSCVEMNGSFITSCFVFASQIVVGVICTKIFVGQSKAVSFLAPMTGSIIPLSNVNDSVFAQETLGGGFAIIPTDNKVYSPFDGEIISLYPTKHAIGLKDKNNNEVLIHIGIDTVLLQGEGFVLHVAQGDQVKSGQLLLEFDEALMKSKNIDLTTPIIFVGNHNIDNLKQHSISAKTQLIQI